MRKSESMNRLPEDPGMILGKCLSRTFSESGGKVFGEFHRPARYMVLYIKERGF